MKKPFVLLVAVIAMIFCMLSVSHVVNASISPTTLSATLLPGQTVTETKYVVMSDAYWSVLAKDGQLGAASPQLEVLESAYDSWLTSVSPSDYTGVAFDSSATFTFVINITVPAGTAPGTYIFHIVYSTYYPNIYGTSAIVGENQTVTITVAGPANVVPEVPIGIGASAAMIVALAVYLAVPKLKTLKRN